MHSYRPRHDDGQLEGHARRFKIGLAPHLFERIGFERLEAKNIEHAADGVSVIVKRVSATKPHVKHCRRPQLRSHAYMTALSLSELPRLLLLPSPGAFFFTVMELLIVLTIKSNMALYVALMSASSPFSALGF